jgi:transcription initiation factor IIE alpha subunit
MSRDYTHDERREAQQVCPSCDADLWDMTPSLARDTEGVYDTATDTSFEGSCPKCGGDLGGGRTAGIA